MKTFLKVMREIKENGKYVTMFNNKVHKREWVKQCFMYEEIAEWADTLLEFKPELDYEALRFIIQQMKFGNLEYEQKDGVQNLTRAFKKITRTSEGYKLLKLNVF